MADKSPTRSEILDTVQAQSESLQEMSERLVRTEKLVEKQESRNQNALYAVIIGFFFIVVSVAVEVIISTKHEDAVYAGVYNAIISMEDRVLSAQHQIDLLRAKNPYLK